jgi:hypothetical protein
VQGARHEIYFNLVLFNFGDKFYFFFLFFFFFFKFSGNIGQHSFIYVILVNWVIII